MIASFADKETEKICQGIRSRKFPPDIQERALRKLRQLEAAVNLDDLRLPPSNRLEALSGNRAGQYSIRITKQWRLCFIFHNGNADRVEIIDYH